MERCAKWLLCGALGALFACSAPPPPAPPTETPVANAPSPDALTLAYERSIRAAAVRDPGFAVALRTIGPQEHHVRVATFTEWDAPKSPTQRLTWVSLPDQLKALCHGKPDAVLAIQQALGLPPQATPATGHQWAVITFEVPRQALFRPCPGGTDVGAPRCANPLAAAATIPSIPADTLDAETTRFLLDQLWSSFRVGFHGAGGEPDWGYPFTGMGWTYNWDPQAASPVGVSEFVVRGGSRLADVVSTTPAQFCNAGSR
jgi:hypothetical protein